MVLSLGSNMGDREFNIVKAVEALKACGVDNVRISSFYETAPVGYTKQSDFLNIALSGTTRLAPRHLLSVVHDIERSMHRRRDIRWGPRPIDIDIIFFGNRKINEPDLVIPHPEYKKRAFVLVPVLEILPGFRDLEGIPLENYLKMPEVAGQGIKKREVGKG